MFSGDAIIVREVEVSYCTAHSAFPQRHGSFLMHMRSLSKVTVDSEEEPPLMPADGTMQLVEVPGDNSCLFTALGWVRHILAGATGGVFALGAKRLPVVV